MEIEVRSNGDVIFEGDAETFLEINNYETEMEMTLDELYDCKIGTIIPFWINGSEYYEIERINRDLWN